MCVCMIDTRMLDDDGHGLLILSSLCAGLIEKGFVLAFIFGHMVQVL